MTLWSIAAQLREAKAKIRREAKRLANPQPKREKRERLGLALVKRQERAEKRALHANGQSILDRGKR